ncbi:tripartite motif-containing protein 3-like [Haliotis rufescens]|uniref:tripartite motif-containing protein 3-like n=1 Tax=Haliotis rufescens TaxID=6454 RepID=UPI001EB0A555|nr:tripartite motif-containing protein 3-like [Haliotis rufescens]
MQNPIQELLQCAVCLGTVARPRVLPCFHSFCESCLTTHIRTTTGTSRFLSRKFNCPSCRISTDLPPGGTDAFPHDFRLIQFTDALKTIVNLKKEGLCGICCTEEYFRSAKQFCADCQKYFCNDCSLKHRLTPVLSHHFMLDLPVDGQSAGPSCHTHPKESAKYVCSTCTFPVCVICVMGQHKFHNIAHLNPSSSLQRTELHDSMSHIREHIWSIHETLFNLTCLEGKLKGLFEESRLQIKKRSRKLINRILGDEGQILKDLEAIYDTKCSEVFKMKEKCRKKLSSCETLQSHIGTLLRSDDLHELLIKYPNLSEELEKTRQPSDLLKSQHLLTFVKFKPGHFKLGKLLEVDVKDESRTLVPQETTHIPDTSDSNTSGEEPNTRTYIPTSLRLVTDTDDRLALSDVDDETNDLAHNLQLRTGVSPMPDLNLDLPYKTPLQLRSVFGSYGRSMGSMCLPYNICFTREDKLVVAENGNRRLQVFDIDGESIEFIGSGEIIPRCVTQTPSGDLAVTDELSKTIKVYDLGGNLKMTLNPIGATFPFGLATSQTGLFIFTDMIFENISIITASGILKRQFGSHGCTQDRFDNPGYISVSQHDKIFVSDSSNHAIKVFDMNGTFLYKFGCYGTSDGRLRYPKAVCFDIFGNIFIADSGNDRVVLFSSIGQYLGVVVGRDQGLQRPTGLSYSNQGYLAVSMPDMNEIRIYHLISRAYPDVRL